MEISSSMEVDGRFHGVAVNDVSFFWSLYREIRLVFKIVVPVLSKLWSLWQWRGTFFLSSRMMVVSCSRLFCVVVLQSQLQSSPKCEVAGGEVRPIQCGSWVLHCGNSKVSQFSDGTFKLTTRPKDGRQGELKLPGCAFEPPVVSLAASSVNCIHFI